MTLRNKGDAKAPIESRVSILEEAVDNLHDDLADIKGGLKEISDILRDSSKTNWNLVLGGGLLVMALYAAAIHPLADDVDRQESAAHDISTATIQLTKDFNQAQVVQGTYQSRQTDMEKRLDSIEQNGSANADKRISLIEEKLGLPVGWGH